jgi:pimeloyl-ACP methyl ester carboxylesterase
MINWRTWAAVAIAAVVIRGQNTATWRDSSPHRVQFVTVTDGVRLEVLDWGGTGRPLVLLAGYLTAHAYDEFAPQLTGFAHVYGITRRGLGASSRPDSGYTARRSADDVVQVLDALKLEAPVLAGHSFGGQDLSTIGAEYPDRTAGLIYLCSAEDPTLKLSDYGVPPGARPPDAKRLPASMRNSAEPDKRSFAAYRSWQLRTHGVAFPESELRQLYAANPDGTLGEYSVSKRVRDALFAGLRKPEYRRIRVPVLAFSNLPPDIKEQIERYKPETPDERRAMEEKYPLDLAFARIRIRDLQKGVPQARVVEVPGANVYIFLSNQGELIREIHSFMAAMDGAANAAFAGTWVAEMTGLPGVELVLESNGGQVSGSIGFYFQSRGDDGKWQPGEKMSVPLLSPRLEGQVLTFETIHHKQHGSPELGPNNHYRVTFVGANEVRLEITSPQRKEPGPGLKLTRR